MQSPTWRPPAHTTSSSTPAEWRASCSNDTAGTTVDGLASWACVVCWLPLSTLTSCARTAWRTEMRSSSDRRWRGFLLDGSLEVSFLRVVASTGFLADCVKMCFCGSLETATGTVSKRGPACLGRHDWWNFSRHLYLLPMESGFKATLVSENARQGSLRL